MNMAIRTPRVASAKPVKASGRRQRVPSFDEIAAIDFRPYTLDLSDILTAEDLAGWIVPVRVAAALLNKPKEQMVGASSTEELASMLAEDGVATAIVSQLGDAAEKLGGLAKICAEAKRRYLIALHATGLALESAEKKGGDA